MKIFVLFLTSWYFNKGAHYSVIALFISGSQTPPNLFSNIIYSWMRHAVRDQNVKKTTAHKCQNVKLVFYAFQWFHFRLYF